MAVICITLLTCLIRVYQLTDLERQREITALNLRIGNLQKTKADADTEDEDTDPEEEPDGDTNADDTDTGGSTDNTETTDCPSSLTSSEQDELAYWETVTNEATGYSLMHPGWTEELNEENNLRLTDLGDTLTFTMRSGPLAVMGFEGYTLDSSEYILVACEETTRSNFSNGDLRLVLVTFSKESTDHTIMLTYQDIGASLSSDIVQAFDLLLKTITFL